MQQGTLTGAYAQAVQDAANNSNGAANGFMGVGMMNMASGGMVMGNAQGVFNNQQASGNVQNIDPYNNGTATTGAAQNASAPVADGAKFCPNCGTKSEGGKFCVNCGTQLM